MTRKSLLLLPLAAMILATWNALAVSPTASSANDEASGGNGEQLWADNCLRCHNIRPPQMYTPVQWQVIVHHMRIRANLTGRDARAITEFLKSASK